tara:strand:+ start:57 stop:218 length:162 start_codon:yes stop_codon:yes gene_type:complete
MGEVTGGRGGRKGFIMRVSDIGRVPGGVLFMMKGPPLVAWRHFSCAATSEVST